MTRTTGPRSRVSIITAVAFDGDHPEHSADAETVTVEDRGVCVVLTLEDGRELHVDARELRAAVGVDRGLRAVA